MRMTIEDCIEYMETEYRCVKSDDMTSEEDIKTYEMTLSIMRKYQKIEEIVGNYGFDTSWICLKKIREVMEDGNVD